MIKHTNKSEFSIIPVLIINLLIPGFGTLLAGNKKDGYFQLGLLFMSISFFVLGLLFTLTIIGAVIGIPMIILSPGIFVISFVWALISSFDN